MKTIEERAKEKFGNEVYKMAIGVIESVKKYEAENQWKSLIIAEYIDDYSNKELRDCLEYLIKSE